MLQTKCQINPIYTSIEICKKTWKFNRIKQEVDKESKVTDKNHKSENRQDCDEKKQGKQWTKQKYRNADLVKAYDNMIFISNQNC